MDKKPEENSNNTNNPNDKQDEPHLIDNSINKLHESRIISSRNKDSKYDIYDNDKSIAEKEIIKAIKEVNTKKLEMIALKNTNNNLDSCKTFKYLGLLSFNEKV